MKKGNIKSKFIDSPSPVELKKTIKDWQIPAVQAALKDALECSLNAGFSEISRLSFDKLLNTRNIKSRKLIEIAVIDWLFKLIRFNVKRGYVFRLREVFKEGLSDCLGYAKLFTVLGRHCGLNVGVTEVIIDNGGRIVPHTANLVFIADKKPLLIDLWYGSSDINHRRISIMRQQNRPDLIEDLDLAEIKYSLHNCLPDYVVDSLTLYVEANRNLKNENFKKAVDLYNQAIYRYPTNSRYYYNRAVALDNLGYTEKALKDYSIALKDDSSILRTLATQPIEVVNLVNLDLLNIPDERQTVYLFSRGFLTGRKMAPSKIALKLKIPLEEVKNIIKSIETQLKSI